MNGASLALLAVLVAGASITLALITAWRVSRYGAAGMTASMAAMMAAMGTGLSVGYAAGMVWDLAWATLAGVAAGFGHGLWMGRRYGPMAALEGIGGGAMGGLMGPMLSVMLIALPLGMAWTALLMLALQWAFSVGAIYLVAAAAGQAPATGPLAWAGWLLGAHLVPEEAVQDPREPAPAPWPGPRPPVPRQRAHVPAGTRSGRRPLGGVAIAVLGAGALAAAYAARAVTTGSKPDSDATPVVSQVGPDGVQDVQLTLQAAYYGPSVVEVRRGLPTRVTLTAVGEPG